MRRWTLKQIKGKLKEISDNGWVRSNRRHDTGIGKTLEDLLHIRENNIALPDFGVMELKSQRINTSSMMTLFTKKPEGITNAEIRERFGYPDPEYPNIKIIHQTITNGRRNAQGFGLSINNRREKLFLKKDYNILGYYNLEFLKEKALEKVGNGLILALAETKRQGGHEYFHFKEAYILKDIDLTKFITHSKYDIRLGVYHSGQMAGRQHDHGSAFRITAKAIPELFGIKKKIL